MATLFPDFDVYEELEVSRNASQPTIEAAYKALLKRYHPDAAEDKTAAVTKAKRINAAHDVLKDPATRMQYDQHLLATEASGRSNRHGGTSASERKSRQEQTTRRGSLACDRCGKTFKTAGGQAWHDENNRNCAGTANAR